MDVDKCDRIRISNDENGMVRDSGIYHSDVSIAKEEYKKKIKKTKKNDQIVTKNTAEFNEKMEIERCWTGMARAENVRTKIERRNG